MQEHHVVVIGGGFAGLQLVNDLKGAPVRITLIDRRNHHLFQPLLYQVATTLLSTSEIAWPIRSLYRDRPEVTTLLAEVVGVDRQAKTVGLKGGEIIGYDTLVLATGATHAYFGHDEWEPVAPGLKTLEDATTIRRRVLLAFEQAEMETDPAVCEALLTFTIAFSRKPILSHRAMTYALPTAILAPVMFLLVRAALPVWATVGLHLAAFFVAAMVCHGELANDRPSPKHLTEFFLLMSR